MFFKKKKDVPPYNPYEGYEEINELWEKTFHEMGPFSDTMHISDFFPRLSQLCAAILKETK